MTTSTPSTIHCPRALTDMSPCVARDGRSACDNNGACATCGENAADLLADLVARYIEAVNELDALKEHGE